MKTNQTLFFLTLFLICLFIMRIPLAQSEILHSWNEPHPDHSWGGGNEQLFNTFTSKSATLTEENLGGFGSTWKLTASATASAGAQVPLPDPGNRSREWDASGLMKATGDKDTVDPHSGDGLPVYVRGPAGSCYDYSEKVIASTDNSTTARTVRKGHIIYYTRPLLFGDIEQRAFDVSTNGDKSRSSISPSVLTANPWASASLSVKRRINLNNHVDGSPFTSTTPNCTSSGSGHTCGRDGGNSGNSSNSGNTNTGSTENHVVSPEPTVAVSCGCSNNETYNYCDDQGSCSTRSTSGVPGECGHNYCCCSPAAPLYNGGTSGNSGSSDSTPDCSYCTEGCSSCSGSSDNSNSDDSNSGNSGNSNNSGQIYCSNCEDYYWDSPISVSSHTQSHTCARSGCGATFTDCQNYLGSCLVSNYYVQWYHQKP